MSELLGDEADAPTSFECERCVGVSDDETVAKFSITTGALGNVRLETLRAFDEDECRNLVRGLS